MEQTRLMASLVSIFLPMFNQSLNRAFESHNGHLHTAVLSGVSYDSHTVTLLLGTDFD